MTVPLMVLALFAAIAGLWLVTSFAGGFAGFNFGAINQAYARGAVTAGANSFAGGFVAVGGCIALTMSR